MRTMQISRPAHPDRRFSWQGPRSGPLVTQPVVGFTGGDIESAGLMAWQIQDPSTRGRVPTVTEANIARIPDLVYQIDRSLGAMVFVNPDVMSVDSWMPLLCGDLAHMLVVGVGWSTEPDRTHEVLGGVLAEFQDRGGILAVIGVDVTLVHSHPFYQTADLVMVGADALRDREPADLESLRDLQAPVGMFSVDSFRAVQDALAVGVELMTGPATNRLAAYGCVDRLTL